MVRTGIARLVVAAAVAVCWSVVPARAQDFPTRPISIIVGVAPGGITDVSTRIYADAVAKSIGQKIVVENRPVGGGTVAAVAVQNAPARRLYAPHHHRLRPCGDPGDAAGRLRPGEGLHAGDAAVPDAGAAGGSPRQPGEVGRRPAGARPQAARRPVFRLRRRRHARAPDGGAHRARHQDADRVRAVPRRRAADGRPDHRPHRLRVRVLHVGARQPRRRQAARARGRRRDAPAGDARRADADRGRAGARAHRQLVRPGRAGRHARRGGRAAQCRIRQGGAAIPA